MNTYQVTKRVSEVRAFEVSMGPRMRPQDSIDSISAILASDDLTIDSITHDTGVVTFRVAGGTRNTLYPILIKFAVTGEPPQMLEAEISLLVW